MRVTLGLFLALTISLSSDALQKSSATNGAAGTPESRTLTFSGENWGQPAKTIPPLTLPDGRLLLTVGDTIYMLTSDGTTLWKHSARAQLTAIPLFIADRNEIAIIGLDLMFQRLDASTGQLLWEATTNGSAGFVAVRPYRNGYVVLFDMSAYREKNEKMGDRSPEIPDSLVYFGEPLDANWSADFPIGAELAVAGDHIYAIKHEEKSVTLQEIIPPLVERRFTGRDRMRQAALEAPCSLTQSREE